MYPWRVVKGRRGEERNHFVYRLAATVLLSNTFRAFSRRHSAAFSVLLVMFSVFCEIQLACLPRSAAPAAAADRLAAPLSRQTRRLTRDECANAARQLETVREHRRRRLDGVARGACRAYIDSRPNGTVIARTAVKARQLFAKSDSKVQPQESRGEPFG
jgi:hypothetical protein